MKATNPTAFIVWATVFGTIVVSSAAAGHDRVPEGLSASDWSSIRAVYDAGRHAVFAGADGYVARNPGQQWRTRFDGRGFVTTPDLPLTEQGSVQGSAEWSWGLELFSFGVAGDERGVERPERIEAQAQRVEYHWDENITEWYINDPRGLEHGFTILRQPDGQSPDGGVGAGSGGLATSARDRSLTVAAPSNVAALQFTLAVRGELRPRVSGDGRGVTFVDERGAAVVNYGGLSVFDADGTELPAWFEAGGQNPETATPDAAGPREGQVCDPQLLAIVVDDTEAVYPLTIDPIAQQAYLKASTSDGYLADDGFGRSVAVSGDTAVVGALGESSSATGVNGNQADNSATDAGAAYVFVRDGNGTWTQQAYLKASNTGVDDRFGYSVAVSVDTVVVGALFEDSSATGVDGKQADNSAAGSGAAYVFVRSGGLWSQQGYLKASNTGAGDQFGYSVAVSGDTVVVGAWGEDSSATGVNGNQADNSATDSGAAYVFVRSGMTWSQQAYIKASNTDGVSPGDAFGTSVAMSGDTVVVGARWEDSSAMGVNGNQANNGATNAGAAYVFVRDGNGTWTQQAYLKASNTEWFDSFGASVAISGDTVVVGAPWEDSNATGVNGNQGGFSASSSGAAYVFVRNGGVWSQQAYLKASNTGGADQFGASVAVSGDTVVVGAQYEDSSAAGVNGNQADNSAPNSGAAYVFVRNGTTWSQQAYVKASNTETNDYFGYSVAVSGDTVVVGACCEDSSATGVDGNQADNSATDSGAAYVFVRSGMTWSQQAYIKASNTDGVSPGDGFGTVAVSGDTVVVGAPGESSSATGVNGNQADNSATEAGAAYVFVHDSNGTWSQQAYLKASNTAADDRFGYSVAVSGDTVVVGAWREDSSTTGVNGNQADDNAADSGAAYVFVRNGTTWSQQAYLKASNTGADDFFGHSVAVSGDTVVVGACCEDSSATGVDGNQADNSATDSGAAYVFVRSGMTWSQQAYIKASNTDGVSPGDGFGTVAVSGDTVVVGAPGESSSATGVNGNQADNSATEAGAAYVFVRDGNGVWSQQAYLKASNTGAFDLFGVSVAISGNTVVVGAHQEDSSATGVNGNQNSNGAPSSGVAYVFVRDGMGIWSQQAYLKASNTGAFDFFGISVAISGDTVVVGAFEEASSATGVDGNQADNSAGDSGAAYVFVRSGGVWSQQAYLKASNAEAGDRFGWWVAVSGDTVVVGAPGEASSATGMNGNQANNSATDSGAAYVFTGVGPPAVPVDLVAANPPVDNAFLAGQQPFLDVLQTGATPAVTQGIGAAGTPTEDSITYSAISLTFSGAPSSFTTDDIAMSCTGGTCPTVTGISGSGVGPYVVTLSGPIPPGHCTTLALTGAAFNPGQKVQYQYLPTDHNLNGTAAPSDILFLLNNVAAGTAGGPNLARFDTNRTGSASAADILRSVGLQNGVNTTQAWSGMTVVPCPP